MQNEFGSIKFPEDELAHNNIVEWWYFNGHLEDEERNKYSFMNCLFKVNVKGVDVKKLKIPLLSKLPLKTIYFSHSILFDISHKKSYPCINYISMISGDSFSKPLLLINYTNPMIFTDYSKSAIEEVKKFKYHIKTANTDLTLKSVKEPLLEGGNIYTNLSSKDARCYSLTNLKTEGMIKIENKPIKVKGKSWMDHQWADINCPINKWTWFSIQLDNEVEIVCFECSHGKVKTRVASISYPNGKQEHNHEAKFTPLGIKWTSPKTKADYPLSWKIEISSRRINLEVVPLIKNQEMTFGTINYWEGPLTVRGVFNNEKVKGLGFLELVGYSSEWSNLKFVKSEVENLANKVLSFTKKETRGAASTIKTKMAGRTTMKQMKT